jgi:hypothetical protein
MAIILRPVFCWFCVTILSLTSCASKTLDVVNNDSINTANQRAGSNEKLSYIDLQHPSLVQPIDSNDTTAEGSKFVKVEVVEVVNPKKYPIALQVHYETRAKQRIYLGSFGLFPADNPGKFIVTTRGQVKNEGAIVLTLVKPDKLEPSDIIKLGIRSIKLVKQG